MMHVDQGPRRRQATSHAQAQHRKRRPVSFSFESPCGWVERGLLNALLTGLTPPHDSPVNIFLPYRFIRIGSSFPTIPLRTASNALSYASSAPDRVPSSGGGNGNSDPSATQPSGYNASKPSHFDLQGIKPGDLDRPLAADLGLISPVLSTDSAAVEEVVVGIEHQIPEALQLGHDAGR
jgi:hypothetical protein